jgi:hypothetical protein
MKRADVRNEFMKVSARLQLLANNPTVAASARISLASADKDMRQLCDAICATMPPDDCDPNDDLRPDSDAHLGAVER